MADEPTTDPKPDPKPAESELGDAGRRALEQEREARRAAEKRASAAEEKLSKIERDQLLSKVAGAKGLTDDQAKRLRGTTREELDADADELLAAFKPEGDDSSRHRGRPQENLRSGAVPGVEGEDVDAIADRVLGG